MNDFKTNVIGIFNNYKCRHQSDELRLIPIYNEQTLIGFLKPVTYHYKLISPEYISLFSQWRKENPVGFATIFEITDKRTEYWLDNILLNREDRILFVICSLKGEPIGHLGFSSFNFEEYSCEIDNVVRGIRNGHDGIMTFALKSILLWGRNSLNLKNIFLRVLADNHHAVKFYERNGFTKQYDIPLFKVIKNEETNWIETKSFEEEKPDRFYTYMKLTETHII